MDPALDVSPTEQLRLLTREMLQSAQAGDWERLTQLEKTRLPLLEQVFAHGVADNVELAEDVLATDEKTKALVAAEMPRIQSELQKLKNSGMANAAYQTVEGFADPK